MINWLNSAFKYLRLTMKLLNNIQNLIYTLILKCFCLWSMSKFKNFLNILPYKFLFKTSQISNFISTGLMLRSSLILGSGFILGRGL